MDKDNNQEEIISENIVEQENVDNNEEIYPEKECILNK
jgi:hypothetical protein